MTDDLYGPALRALAHELRRPLTVIRGAATMLVDDADRMPPATRTQMLGLIDSSAQGMAEMIDDLLIAVHLDLGDLRLTIQTVGLSELIAEAVGVARRHDGEHPVEVRGAEGLLVEADREQAVRALRAILVNAVAYSDESAPVEVTAAPRAGMVEVAVLDRGPGIPEAQRELAFARFGRLREDAGGAGLGLFLARGLARAMGGDVRIEDREDGGAAVCFSLRRSG